MALVNPDFRNRTINQSANCAVTPEQEQGSNWAIVLAGGSGERMRESISKWMGAYKPKQFCAFTGNRTMLEHTWDRAKQLVGQTNIVTVAVNEHSLYFEQMGSRVPGTLIYQPGNIGTAAAVYLALAYILAMDHKASIILLPSDHFVFPESRFIKLAKEAMVTARRHPQRLVLMGAEASWANTDYGWIESRPANIEQPDDGPLCSLKQVVAFVEKPKAPEANRLYRNGALWSTMIIAATARSLWHQAQLKQPALFVCLLYINRLIRQARLGKVPLDSVDRALKQTFSHMPILDFSRDLLQECADQCLVLPMTELVWDDWGRPERILHCIEQYGLDSSLKARSRFA
jgi:mannose-1-phosphate guanylyltransferase